MEKDQMTYPNLERKLAERHVMKKDIADLLGITKYGMSKKLTGKSDFKLSEAFMIADLLNEPDIRSLFQKRNG